MPREIVDAFPKTAITHGRPIVGGEAMNAKIKSGRAGRRFFGQPPERAPKSLPPDLAAAIFPAAHADCSNCRLGGRLC
jgi:hypothetical protein